MKKLTICENMAGDAILITDRGDDLDMVSCRSIVPNSFPEDMLNDDVSYSIVNEMLEKGHNDIEMPSGPFSSVSQYRQCRKAVTYGVTDLMNSKYYTYLPLRPERMESALMTIWNYMKVDRHDRSPCRIL